MRDSGDGGGVVGISVNSFTYSSSSRIGKKSYFSSSWLLQFHVPSSSNSTS